VVKALLDTSILIDYLRGIPAARDEINLYTAKAISIVTWTEVMIGAPVSAEPATRDFLGGFTAIVWASAQVHAMLLVTRDGKSFPGGEPGVRIPYRI